MGKPSPPQETGCSKFAKFVASFGYAFQGLWYALRTQRNMRVHLVVALIVVIAGLLLRLSTLEFALLAIVIAGVMVAEMFNTVCEACVDLAQPEYHPLARIAKDVAAGAVLLSAILAVVVGILVLGPHLLMLIHK